MKKQFSLIGFGASLFLFCLNVALAEPPQFTATVTGVFQNLARGTNSNLSDDSEFNVRGDFDADWSINSNHRVYGLIRTGKGQGVQPIASTFTGTVNSTTFELDRNVPGTSSSLALLAQAWYQYSQGPVQFTVGKIDPFVFFDNNRYDDDESSEFLNNVFVHNPLLDSGADIGADAYGFGPGIVGAYGFGGHDATDWVLQAGFFGHGNGVSHSDRLSKPFAIVQLQKQVKCCHDQGGVWQFYIWRNPEASNAVTGISETHSGFGYSIAQGLTADLGVFSRLGIRTVGEGSFNQAVTLGGEFHGTRWGRSLDEVGLAFGALKAGKAYENAGNGSGFEKNVELFYKIYVNDHIEVTPSVQWVVKPAALANTNNLTVIGLRTTLRF